MRVLKVAPRSLTLALRISVPKTLPNVGVRCKNPTPALLFVSCETDDLPSLSFVGSALTIGPCFVIQAALLGSGFTAGFACGVFGVFLLRQRGGNTTLAQVLYCNQIFFFTTPDGQAIPFFQAAAGFDPVAIDLDFAAFDGFTGKRAGLEEPRCP